MEEHAARYYQSFTRKVCHMHKFKRQTEIDHSNYAPSVNNPTAFYGLPKRVAFCTSCAITNQRPISALEYTHKPGTQKDTIGFDSAGKCDACHVAELKRNQIDWDERERELSDLCDRFRRDDGRYDCIVPGSGGKDSFVQSHVLKYKYGMHPLTVTWAPHIFTDWGWRNFERWIHSGFDNYLLTPNGRIHRLLTRLAVETLFHPFQAFILGQKSIAMSMALKLDIPLILYGDHAAEWGTPKKDFRSSQLSWDEWVVRDETDYFIGGVSVAELKSDFGVNDNDLLPYMPVNMHDVTKSGIEVHFMGYYMKWHPQANYYYAVENGGFEPSPERTAGTYSKYSSLDDKMDDFNFYTSYIKFGYGRAMMDASQEVRNGDIDRDEAVALIKRYDGEFPERFADEVFRYLSLDEREFPIASQMFEQPIIDQEYFDDLADSFRSPHIWMRVDGEWAQRYTAWS